MSASVLLVEDDPANRLVLSKTLESVGYQVTTAIDGSSAFELLERMLFDVVVVDMRLPDADGIDVLHAATSRDFPPSVIMLTGYGSLDSAIEALRAGASDYLLKPCSPQVLLNGVAKALQRRAASLRQADTLRSLAEGMAQLQRQLQTIGPVTTTQSPLPPVPKVLAESDVLSFGDLQVGRFPHETRYQKESIHVTPIEHTILRCLIEAGGNVVSYSDIVQRTHGYRATDSDAQALLKSHVRNLRIKTSSDLIASVRNIGYRLADED